jgi:hypothetical protein
VNSPGASAHARLGGALEKILRDRGLSEPHGGPLYTYRFTADEIATLKQTLSQVLAWAGPTCLDTQWCARAFVVIASDWLCHWHGEGPWGYAPLCADLGLQYRQDHWQAVTAGIRDGLRGWGRRVRRNEDGDAEYLASLICEGGLPLRAVRGGRWLYQWLQGALDLAARAVEPSQAAAQEAWRAPPTFGNHLIPVAAELVGELYRIKQDLPASTDRAGLDAVAWLDLNRPGWRDALPLDMADDDARTLIERVVRRIERGASANLAVRRGLVQAADGFWDFTVELALEGAIEHSQLPRDLGSQLAGKLRARIRPAGDLLAYLTGDLAILQAYEEDDISWWHARLLRRLDDLRCPPETRIELAVESHGAPLGNLHLPEADGLSREPMAFMPDQRAPGRLLLAARGSHTTRLPDVTVAIPRACSSGLKSVAGSAQCLGYTRDLDLALYRVDGELELAFDGQLFRWRTGAERETMAALEIGGRAEPGIRRPAWSHDLELWVRQGSSRRRVKPGDLQWRPARGGPWRFWAAASPPRGDVTFVLIRDGATVSRVTAAVAPSGFSIRSISQRQRAVAISGLEQAAVTIAATVKTDRAGDPIIVDRAGAIGNHFTLDAVWPDGTSWHTQVYDRTAGASFTDSSGIELPHGWRGCIDAVSGVYAACSDYGKLTFEIVSSRSRRCITRPVRGEIPLYAFREDLRALLATTGRLDAAVLLEWVGVGGRRIEIGLFDVALEAQDGEVWPSFADLKRVAASGATRVTLLASPLAEPVHECVLHDGTPDAYRLRRFAPPATAPGGPWLVYGRIDDRFRIRPRVVYTRSLDRPRTRLLGFVLSPDSAERRRNLAHLLRSNDATEQEIDDARRLIVSLQARTPLQCLDLAVALIAAPQAALTLLSTCSESELDAVLALEQEMNFLWCVTPVHGWREAFGRRENRLRSLMSALPAEDAARYARDDVESILQAIVARHPALVFHAFCVIGERLGSRIADWLVDASREASDCVARNGHAEDGVFWPIDLVLAARLGGELPGWIQGKQRYCWDVLAAPLVAARVAAGRVAFDQSLITELRWARLFDPTYFDRIVPCALLPLAAENVVHA